jgi:hypothetical protein
MTGSNQARAVTALIKAALGQPHPTPALKKALRPFTPEPKLPERLPTWWPHGRPLPKDLAKQMQPGTRAGPARSRRSRARRPSPRGPRPARRADD